MEKSIILKQAHIVTSIQRIVGALPWIVMAICFLLGFFLLLPWCLCCVPFYMDNCRDVIHSCPSCKRILGRFTRIWKNIAIHIPECVYFFLSDFVYQKKKNMQFSLFHLIVKSWLCKLHNLLVKMFPVLVFCGIHGYSRWIWASFIFRKFMKNPMTFLITS